MEARLKVSTALVWFATDRDHMAKQKQIKNKRSTDTPHQNTNSSSIMFSVRSNTSDPKDKAGEHSLSDFYSLQKRKIIFFVASQIEFSRVKIRSISQ